MIGVSQLELSFRSGFSRKQCILVMYIQSTHSGVIRVQLSGRLRVTPKTQPSEETPGSRKFSIAYHEDLESKSNG